MGLDLTWKWAVFWLELTVSFQIVGQISAGGVAAALG
jgi:hypothetical protein